MKTKRCTCNKKKDILDVKLSLKKFYGDNQKYIFTTCCKNIVSLKNCCTEDEIAFKILGCKKFKNIKSIFTIDQICISYTNLTICASDSRTVKNENDCLLIPLNTHNQEKENHLCIHKIIVTVTPTRLCIHDIGKCISLGELVDIVSYDKNSTDCIMPI